MLDKRAQGRPPRGAATVGPRKIVEGMQDALRTLQSNNITRKDVARFAGVTPALVTYYFPERNTLIEAATVPVVERLATGVRHWASKEIDPNCILLNIIYELLTCYSNDSAILELYISHRRSNPSKLPQDELDNVYALITIFFDKWLSLNNENDYDGTFMTNILVGICRSVAYNQLCNSLPIIEHAEQQNSITAHAKMIYKIIVGILPGLKFAEPQPVDDFEGNGIARPTLDRSVEATCSDTAG